MRTCCVSDKGPVRSENQDRGIAVKMKSPRCSILVVCDGMGGANSGSLASLIASETYLDRIKRLLVVGRKQTSFLPQWMQESCAAANAAVYERGSDPAHSGMGTTLVSAVLIGRRAEIINVGDSRAYHISRKNNSIVQITRDHSLVEDLVEYGAITKEQAKHHPQRNVITRALGSDADVEADYYEINLALGDMLILCSDGLSNIVSDEEILDYAVDYPEPEILCRALMSKALNRGARDNVTVVVIKR